MYENKTINEQEALATNPRLQIALYPDHDLEVGHLRECERWIEQSRHEEGLNLKRVS